MACSGCYIKVIKRDTNTVYQKKRTQAAGQPASDVLMNSDGSAHYIFTHTKYTFDQKNF